MSPEKYVAYEQWSRKDFKAAYEEADGLLKKAVAERKVLQDEVNRLRLYEQIYPECLRHIFTLGKVIKELLESEGENETSTSTARRVHAAGSPGHCQP